MGNTSLSPAASNIIVACDCGLPLHPAVPRVILNGLGERIGDLVDKEPFPPFFVASYARPAQPQAQPKSALWLSEIKENKTPGDEHYLDPPGAELLAWSKNQPSKLAILVAVPRHDDLVNYHVVAVLDVVNANLRIFSDFRSFDNLSIGSHVCDSLAELVVHGLGCFSF